MPQPLPQALITAAKLRKQIEAMTLLVEELEASVASQEQGKPAVFAYGEVKNKKERRRS